MQNLDAHLDRLISDADSVRDQDAKDLLARVERHIADRKELAAAKSMIAKLECDIETIKFEKVSFKTRATAFALFGVIALMFFLIGYNYGVKVTLYNWVCN